jgi:hypothetical protein
MAEWARLDSTPESPRPSSTRRHDIDLGPMMTSTPFSPPGQREKFRLDDVRIWHIGESTSALFSPRTNRVIHISHETAQFISRCTSFRTLEQHAERSCGELGIHQDQCSAELTRIFSNGFFLSEDGFIDGLRRKSEETTKAPLSITAIGVLTHDRVNAIEPCLRSYARNLETHGRTAEVIVTNDSRDPNVERNYKDRLLCLRPSLGAPLLYSGAAEKSAFAEALAHEAAVDPAIVRFALFDTEKCGYSEGANRNALALDTVDRGLFCADDDTLCQIALIPDQQPGLDMVSKQNPTRVRYYQSHDQAQQSVAFVEEDLLAMHEALLGRSAEYLLTTHRGNGVGLDQASPGFLRHLATRGGTVRVSWTGILGDSGWTFPTFALLEEGAARDELLEGEEHYRASYCSRQILRGVPRTTVSDGPYCQTTFLAFDHRGCLPPFMPVQRGPDVIFGVTMRMCMPDSYVGYVPRALLHVPVTVRKNLPEDVWRPAHINLYNVVLESLTYPIPFTSNNVEDNIRKLGDRVVELGALPERDFKERICGLLLNGASMQIRSLEHLLKKHRETPTFWADDVKRRMAALRSALIDPTFFVPIDLQKPHSHDAVLTLTQRLVLKFGQLLQAWPQLVQAARALREKGIRVAQPI